MKSLKIIFLSLSFSAFLITPVLAITSTSQMPIPNANPNDGGIDFRKEVDFSKYNSLQPLGEYIKYIMKYVIGICAILGTIMVMIGGFKYVLSGGDSGMIKDAQDTIFSAFIGIILAASSYLILATVNMDLVNFKSHPIKMVEEISYTPLGVCMSGTGAMVCEKKTKAECDTLKGTFILIQDEEKIISNCTWPWLANNFDCTSRVDLSICKTNTDVIGSCINNACTDTKGEDNEICGSLKDSGVCQPMTQWCSYPAWGGRDCNGISLKCCGRRY